MGLSSKEYNDIQKHCCIELPVDTSLMPIKQTYLSLTKEIKFIL